MFGTQLLHEIIKTSIERNNNNGLIPGNPKNLTVCGSTTCNIKNWFDSEAQGTD